LIFDGKPIDDISDEEIDKLVNEHMSERQHLEFKVTLNQNEPAKHELLRDIVSLANAGGGYLIIGIRDDGKGRAQRYEPDMIGDTQRIKQAVNSLCLEHIRDRIDGLEIKLRTVRGNPLVIVRVPTSTRIPHMVTFQNSTDFYTRYGDGKREMTMSEIREAFNQDAVALRLSRIETQLQTTISTLAALQRGKREEEIQEGIVPRFLSIEDGKTLADETLHRFIKEVGNEPFFRVSVTPVSPKEGLIDVASEPIRTLINNPPGSRRSGWNMEAGYRQIERFVEGIRRGEKNKEYLELLSNGHMEFWTPLDENFCWRQSPEEFSKRPRLYPYPVIEYPTTFLRLYRAIVDSLRISNDFIVDLCYLNLKGYILAPYAPNAIGFMDADTYSKPFEDKHLRVTRRTIKDDFDPDQTAYELIQTVYAAFGFDESVIPFFTGEGRFDFPS